MKWFSIDTVPISAEDEIIWFVYYNEDGFIGVAFTENGIDFYTEHHSDTYGTKVYGLTHWAELPNPPAI